MTKEQEKQVLGLYEEVDRAVDLGIKKAHNDGEVVSKLHAVRDLFGAGLNYSFKTDMDGFMSIAPEEAMRVLRDRTDTTLAGIHRLVKAA